MGRVNGKIVVVTGAAGGQGAVEAQALASEGATVIATDIRKPDLGTGIEGRALDVTDGAAWAKLGASSSLPTGGGRRRSSRGQRGPSPSTGSRSRSGR